jgi:hypothetical protein
MNRHEGLLTAVSIALHRGLYLDIIMVPYGGPHITLTIALHRSLYLAIIMTHYEGPHSALNTALHGGL